MRRFYRDFKTATARHRNSLELKYIDFKQNEVSPKAQCYGTQVIVQAPLAQF